MTNIPISIILGSPRPDPIGIPLPSTGNYKFIQHDDLANDDKGQRIRAPEVWPLYWVEYTDLTCEWQWFWFRAGLVHPYTGYKHWDETLLESWELERLMSEWGSLTHGAKAFTNNLGTDVFKDCINQKNLNKGLPKQGAITCCGNFVRVMGNSTSKGTPIETLDGSFPPPPIEKINRLTRPDLLFCATNVPGIKVAGVEYPLIVTSGDNYGRIKVDPFPNIWEIPNSKSMDTLVPLRTNGNKSDLRYERDGVRYARNYIRTSRLVNIQGKVVPTPYVH
jgi:hypothetical protein